MKAKIIFTCFSFDQVSFGSCAPPMISFDDCLQSQWSEAKAQPSPVSCIVILLIPPRLHLGHRCNREDGACVVGGRTIVCELGCPFRSLCCLLFASPAFFFCIFLSSPHFFPFFIEHEVMLERLTVKLMSPHL